MAKRFYTVKCPHCLRPLKTNNVLFREKNNNGDYYYFDPAICEIKRDEKYKRRIEGISYNDHPITERCCPYCKGKLPNLFGTYKTKYIALIGLLDDEKNGYIESVVQNLLSSYWTNFSDYDIGLPILKKETGKKGIHTVIYQSSNDLFSDDDNKSNHEIKRLNCADGFIFIINSLDCFCKILETIEKKQNKSSKMPIAFVFNKVNENFKAVWDLIPDTTKDSITTKSMKDGIDKKDIIKRHEEIISHLLNDSLIHKAKKVFGKNCRYFALVSDSREGVETPFLWLLSEVGAFPAIK